MHLFKYKIHTTLDHPPLRKGGLTRKLTPDSLILSVANLTGHCNHDIDREETFYCCSFYWCDGGLVFEDLGCKRWHHDNWNNLKMKKERSVKTLIMKLIQTFWIPFPLFPFLNLGSRGSKMKCDLPGFHVTG